MIGLIRPLTLSRCRHRLAANRLRLSAAAWCRLALVIRRALFVSRTVAENRMLGDVAVKIQVMKKKVLIAEEMPEFEKSIAQMPLSSKIFVDKSMAIADKIYKRIEELGITQKDLADRLGQTEAQVSRGLAGMQNFTLRSISKIEAALNFEIIRV